MKKIRIISIILFILGITILTMPKITDYIYKNNVEKQYIKWKKEKPDDKLLKAMKEYNKEIYKNKQSGITDPFAFPSTCFNLKKYGKKDNIVGFITIKKMHIKLPIYLGATEKNMSKGATQLGLTSLPIGGKNTNCVIAAHRGYSTKAMFRHIEALEKGDIIIIENYWEKLKYKVYDIEIIDPSDVNKILIEDNKDIITLSTCHPYTHNYQRYLVKAKRM